MADDDGAAVGVAPCDNSNNQTFWVGTSSKATKL